MPRLSMNRLSSSINNQPRAKPIVIALSAFVNEEVEAKCHQCGFDDVSKYCIRVKPFHDLVESPLTMVKVQDTIIHLI